jgi:acetyltransferase-like isoleucine patch superfamily enzyme
MLNTVTKNLISVILSFLKFSLIKLFNWRYFHFHYIERFSPNTTLNISKNSYIYLGNKVRAHSNTKLVSANGGELRIEDNVAINTNCGLYCFESISIGTGTEIGPNVLIYDHDHDFRVEGGIKRRRFNTKPVVIGKNVWIGANTVILKGSIIGDNSVIAAGSVITEATYPHNSVIVQKKRTEIISYVTKDE